MILRACAVPEVDPSLGSNGNWQVKYLYGPGDERLWIFDDSGTCRKETFTPRGLGNEVLRDFVLESQGFGPATCATTWTIDEDYIYRGNQLLASENPADGLKHFHLDHLGTPRLVTSGDDLNTQNRPRFISQHHYFPYGEEATVATSLDERMKFTGHERDSHGTGSADDLDYMHARYCDPERGRFLSVDPVGASARLSIPQTLNRYTYAVSNPLRYVDPNGQYQVDFHYNVTQILAFAAGFSAADATSFAHFTQLPDEDDRRPIRLPISKMAENHASIHFASPKILAGSLQLGRSTGNHFLIGQAIHSLGDSFSHAGFNGGIGHDLAGPGPDIPPNNINKAIRASEAVFDYIASLNGERAAPAIGFKKIESRLRFALSAPTREARIELLQRFYSRLLAARLRQQKAARLFLDTFRAI